ncbi:MAG: hypothetical protein WCS43_01340 [Verrucomicrobiota bacterium]
MKNQFIFWIGEIAFARIDDAPGSLKFIVRDDVGSHLSIWRKETDYRFEFSSNKPLGSVWDEARREIARKACQYKNWQKHANYVVNRTLDHYADSEVPLVSMSINRDIMPVREALRKIPAICLQSATISNWISLYFSPSRTLDMPNSVAYEGQIGRLVIVWSQGI